MKSLLVLAVLVLVGCGDAPDPTVFINEQVSQEVDTRDSSELLSFGITRVDVHCVKELPQDPKSNLHIRYQFKYGDRVVKTEKSCDTKPHLISVQYWLKGRYTKEGYRVYTAEAYSYEQVKGMINIAIEDIKKNAAQL